MAAAKRSAAVEVAAARRPARPRARRGMQLGLGEHGLAAFTLEPLMPALLGSISPSSEP